MNTISYDLAKQLKDAGFPQKGASTKCPIRNEPRESHLCDQCAYVPTLSELIEACGNKEKWYLEIGQTSDETHEWYAMTHKNGTPRSDMSKFIENGSNPEEAVAKLWLTLNKK